MRLLIYGALGVAAYVWWQQNRDKSLAQAASDTRVGVQKTIHTIREF